MPLRPSEDDLIARYFAPLAAPEGLGLRDDAALLAPAPGTDLVLTKDALVAGMHFFADDPPGAIARKAMRVNLSDLAAKGATPLGFLLALALPGDWTAEWLAAFAAGLGEDVATYGCPLFGGDTVRTLGPLMVSITMLGAVPNGRFVRRTGVGPDDLLYVSGTIGDAALGLKLRLAAESGNEAPWRPAAHNSEFLCDRYLLPQPRGELVAALSLWASAGMDVSDGLIGDLSKMLRVSGATARIDLSRLPLSPAAREAIAAAPALLETVATGGDDYEILAAVAPLNAARFEAAAARAGVPVTRIGEAAAGDAAAEFTLNGAPLHFASGSFSHF
jgi:thiamine-monophosphate kinase